ncbi:hypothetical protein GA0061105_10983 [Rhizobium aethiopicum]|uniref:Uncharacterized protein n=1 Tax=Rhizobium aethiopicum TaxID=1138170 RepID=A0A1C3Y6M0_9HYPH|nr:hypothetical protein [Rhizobium aethiopicum]SCB60033.1 hypothetical protein GA0061105_10983 [Rhizobium aethiopicum]
MSMNVNRALLQDGLQVLVGLPLSIVRNAADMKVLHFGTIRPPRSGRGTVGEYALHIQCPWRIVSESVVITGTSDRFVTLQGGAGWNDDVPQSQNLQFIRIAALLKGFDEATKSFINTTEQLVVMTASADTYGGADLALSGGYRLQIFPDGSLEEDWRFIQNEGRHFVIEGGRVRIDE